MTRILLVEDDDNLRYGLRFNLEKEGYEVLEAGSAEVGREILERALPELLILDVMLPGQSGFEFLEALRSEDLEVPVVVLTARADEADAVTALRLGADDYVRKPFGLSELLARVAAILRRTSSAGGSELVLGGWRIDLDGLAASGPAGSVRLTHLEAEVLRALAARRGETVPRESLLASIWGPGSAGTTRTLDNHVARLRKKLEEDPQSPTLILTVYGAGYRLAEGPGPS